MALKDLKLGGVLRKLREDAGLTQKEVAQRAGVRREYINMLEQDMKCPSIEVFCRWCLAVGIRPSAVMRQIEQVNPEMTPKNRKNIG